VEHPIPDLRAPLAAVTALARDDVPRIANRDLAGHVAGRVALYADLVPRIERLGADLAP